MTSQSIVEIKRIFAASPAEVFTAWLDRDEWQAWIGPEGVRCDVTRFEPKVGGHYRLVMHLPSGETTVVVGVFQHISRDIAFAFTWGQEGTDQTSLVSVELRPIGDGTELTLRHEGLPTETLREGHAMGWNSALNKLDLHLTQTQAEKQ